MVTCRIKVILALILFSAAIFCAENNEQEQLKSIYENILIKYAKVKYYEADFQQENYWKEMDIIKKSWGKVYFDVDNFIMKYDDPEGQILLIENDSVTMYDAASKQALISNNMETELRPDKLISDYWINSEKKLLLNQEKNIKFKLSTNSKDQFFVLLNDYLIVEILILDEDQNFVLYKFSSAKINEELPESIFDYSFPDDATILDNRQK